MTLDSLCGQYARERDIATGTAAWLRYVAGRYSRFLGRPATIADLSDDSLNAWLAALLAEPVARRTARSYRGALVMLWRFAVDAGLLDALPRRLRLVKAAPLVPCAWTEQEVLRLLDQATAMLGRYPCGVARSTFWVALIRAIWESGLRIGDLLRLRRDQIDQSGRGVAVQNKTDWPIVFQFSERTMTLIREMESDGRPRIFGDCLSRDWVFTIMRRLTTAASLSGGTKKIRKSGATAVERLHPGAAMAYLGHKTPGLAYQYYVDPRLAGGAKVTPPPLDTPPASPS